MEDNSIIGQLSFELGVDRNSLTRSLTQATRDADRQLTSGFSNIAKKVSGILGGIAFGAFVKDCLDLGSDLAEVQNVVDTAFKSMSSYVDSFAKNAMESFGLSETVAKKYMGTIGAMNNAFGFAEKESYKMAEAVTGLAGDVASFYNLSSDEAFTKLKSIWTGETETLKDLGVVMTQTALDQYALNNGFGKTTAKMTEQEKVMLRFQYVTSCLSDATGDFLKTQDSWANQTRVLSLRFESLKATLGQGFINLFTPIIKGLNTLLAKLSTVAEGFKTFTEVITGKTAATESLGNIASVANEAAGSVDNITASAKAAQKQLMGFDKITKLSDTSGTSTATNTESSGALESLSIDNGNTAQETSAFAQSIAKALEPLKNIKFDGLNNALKELKSSLEPLTSKLFDGLAWGYENVFVPLARWTIEDVAPSFVRLLAGALDVLNSVLEALKPLWSWAWDSFFKPIAKWTGGAIVKTLDALTVSLGKVSDWIDDNQKLVQGIAIAIGAFALAFGVFKLGGFLVSIAKTSGLMKNLFKILGKNTASTVANEIETEKLANLYKKDLPAGTSGLVAGIATAITAVSALTAHNETLIKIWESVKETAFGVRDGICNAFQGIAEWFSNNVGIPLSNVFGKTFGDMKILAMDYAEYLKGPWLQWMITIFTTIKQNLEDLSNTFFMVFSDLWNLAVFPILENFINVGLPLFAEFSTQMQLLSRNISGTLQDCFDKVWSEGVAPALTLISDMWIDLMNTISDFWNEWGQPIFDKLNEAVQNTGAVFLDIWDNILKPTWEHIMSAVDELWTEHLQPLVANFLDFVGEFITGASDIYNKFILPVVSYVANVFGPAFVSGFNLIVDIVKNAIAAVADIIDGIITTLKGIIQFVTGVFTGDWDKAWNGIKNILKGITDTFASIFSYVWNQIKTIWSGATSFFSNIWSGIKACFSGVADWFKNIFTQAWTNVKNVFSSGGKIFSGIVSGIKDAFKNVVNHIISGINNVIALPFDKINGMLNKIRSISILGVEPFKELWDKNPLPVPKIPKLAQGGYVKPNTPQLAMIGDNRHQGEVVAPEKKLDELLQKAVAASSRTYDREILMVLKEILAVLKELDFDIVIDGKSLKDIIVQKINEHTRQTGVCEINF